MPTHPPSDEGEANATSGTDDEHGGGEPAEDWDGEGLPEQQAFLIANLPADKYELADALDCGDETVKTHIARIRDKGIPIEWDSANGVYFLHNDPKTRRVATKATGSKTRIANEWATEMEATILRRLKNKSPLTANPVANAGREDMVLHLTDVHMGDVVETEEGWEVFNPEICELSIDHVTQKVLDLKHLMEARVDFDTLHVLWGGDMLTNENIYDGQSWDVRLMLADQMARVVDVLTRQAKSFSAEFDAVQIVAQPGNHGKTRASGVSKQANMDLIAYRWVRDRLTEAGLSNVTFIESEATFFRNFAMRDGRWRGHLRHGQDSLNQVGTSSGRNRWRGWQARHRFDVAYRGHYHESRREDLMNQYPVIESPSMKPGGEFAERIGHPDVSAHRKLATVHGVSDDRVHTWEFVLDDIELELPDPRSEDAPKCGYGRPGKM